MMRKIRAPHKLNLVMSAIARCDRTIPAFRVRSVARAANEYRRPYEATFFSIWLRKHRSLHAWSIPRLAAHGHHLTAVKHMAPEKALAQAQLDPFPWLNSGLSG